MIKGHVWIAALQKGLALVMADVWNQGAVSVSLGGLGRTAQDVQRIIMVHHLAKRNALLHIIVQGTGDAHGTADALASGFGLARSVQHAP